MLTAGFRRMIFHRTEVVNCPMTDARCPMFRPNSAQLTKGTKIGTKDNRIIEPANRNRVSTMPGEGCKIHWLGYPLNSAKHQPSSLVESS